MRLRRRIKNSIGNIVISGKFLLEKIVSDSKNLNNGVNKRERDVPYGSR